MQTSNSRDLSKSDRSVGPRRRRQGEPWFARLGSHKRLGILVFVCAVLGAALTAFVGFSGARTGGVASTANASIAPPPTPTVTLPPSNPSGRAFYVTPDATAGGDGTERHPLDLATALSSNGPAEPGDVIWLRGGTYRGAFTSTLKGTEAAPIIVGQYPGERATIDSGATAAPPLSAFGAFTWYWGFEIMNSDLKRNGPTDLIRQQGVVVQGQELKFINLAIHDMAVGIEIGVSAVGTELYGNLIYNNGWMGPEQGYGDGILVRDLNKTGYIRENVIFNQFSQGIDTTGGNRDSFYLEGNALFNNGAIGPRVNRNLLLAGQAVVKSPVLIENMTYYSEGTAAQTEGANIGYVTGCSGARVLKNYLTGGQPLVLSDCDADTLEGNTLVGRVNPELVKSYPANDYYTPLSSPAVSGVKVFVRPNVYEPGRANIVVFNWDRRSEVSIDAAVAGLKPGERYEIRDAQNFFGPPLVSGEFTDGRIVASLTGLEVAQPVGKVSNPPQSTAPEFAAFVLLKTSAAGVGPKVAAAPTFTPSGGVYTESVAVTLSSATAGAAIRYTTDGSNPTDRSPIYNGPVILNGSSTIVARAIKEGLFASGVTKVPFIVEQRDSAAPTVSITSPRDNAAAAGSVSVNVASADNVGVVEVRLMLDGLTIQRAALKPASAFTWNTKAVPNGTHVLTALARDAAGNQTTASPVRVVVQNTK